MPTPFAIVRKLTLRGIFTVLPLVVTFWLLGLLFGIVNAWIAPLVGASLRFVGVQHWEESRWAFLVPVAGLLVLLGALMLIGLLATNLFGKRLLGRIERLLLSIPLVRAIYGSAKQLIEAFSMGGKNAFQEVVAFEYPRRGIWVLGFVTSSMSGGTVVPGWDRPMVNVFLPTTPNPTSGFLLVLPADEVHTLPVTVEEGIKMIVSGGLVLPPLLERSRAKDMPGQASA